MVGATEERANGASFAGEPIAAFGEGSSNAGTPTGASLCPARKGVLSPPESENQSPLGRRIWRCLDSECSFSLLSVATAPFSYVAKQSCARDGPRPASFSAPHCCSLPVVFRLLQSSRPPHRRHFRRKDLLRLNKVPSDSGSFLAGTPEQEVIQG